MSTSAEQELRKRLSTVLDEMTPGPAPVGAAIRQGRAIRRRRVAGLTASALAAAAVVTAVSLLGLHLPSQTPVAPGPPVVTVVPPGPGAPAGLIASGTVGTRSWSARVTGPRHGQICVLTGAGQICPISVHATSPADLASISTSATSGYLMLAGPVQPRVTRVDVLLADGRRLTLHPVATHGGRWVAFAVPAGIRVSRAVAYDGRAVYRYAVPFSGPPGRPALPGFTTWLRPGAAGLPRQVFTIASGTADGHRWSATEYTGPWGRCFELMPGGGDCLVGDGPVMDAGQLTQGMASVPGGVHLAAAAAGVASVELDLSSGQQLRVATRAGFGADRFYAFVLPHGTQVAGWTAYGPDGKRLGSGPGSTLG